VNVLIPEKNARYALKSEFERERRKELLDKPHIEPLSLLLKDIKKARGPNCEIPNFDPLDGGIDSKAVFFLESPGNMAKGSGFISRNNPDETANNMRQLLKNADLARGDTLLWNIVPWYLGRVPAADEINEAIPYVEQLLSMLPKLKVIVLVGKKAWMGESNIAGFANVPILKANHPSPLNFNSRAYMKDLIQDKFNEAAAIVNPNTKGNLSPTYKIAKALEEFIRDNHLGYKIFYDHGPKSDKTKGVISGVVGNTLKRESKFAEVDILVSDAENNVVAAIEIEDRNSMRPKKILGVSFALLMSDRFFLRKDKASSAFEVSESSNLVIVGHIGSRENSVAIKKIIKRVNRAVSDLKWIKFRQIQFVLKSDQKAMVNDFIESIPKVLGLV
jgi:uracil-DNA glycosylase